MKKIILILSLVTAHWSPLFALTDLRVDANGVLLPDTKVTLKSTSAHAGLNVGAVAGDPSSVANGDLYYDLTANQLKARINGVTTQLGVGITAVPVSRTIFVDVSGDNTTGAAGDMVRPVLTISRAITLATALTPTAANPVVIQVGPGTFTENSGIVLPAYVSLVGAGRTSTILQSSLSSTGNCAAIVNPGNYSVIGFLKIQATGIGSGLFAFPLGAGTPGTGFTGVILRGLDIVGDTDAIYIRAGVSGDLVAFDCILRSKWDSTYIAAGSTADFYNCQSLVIGPAATSSSAPTHGINTGGGTVRWFGGVIQAQGSTASGLSNIALCATSGGVLEVYNTKIVRPTATTSWDLQATSGGSITYSGLARADGAALTVSSFNSGTLTELSRYAVRDNNLSDLTNFATARTNLGLVIGTNVQAYDADLTTWSGITPGTGVGTFLATPTSANLAAALTDEVGSASGGKVVFNRGPLLLDSSGVSSANFANRTLLDPTGFTPVSWGTGFFQLSNGNASMMFDLSGGDNSSNSILYQGLNGNTQSFSVNGRGRVILGDDDQVSGFYTLQINPPSLTASRTLDWPDANGKIGITTGTLTSGDCVKFDASGRLIDAGTTCGGSSAVDDTAFASSWNGVTATAPSKNAVYDWAHSIDPDNNGHIASTEIADFSATAPTTAGQIPIYDPSAANSSGGTGAFVPGDPKVQGLVAEGAAISNPVTIGGKDGSGNSKALVVDSSGRPTVNLNGTAPVSQADPANTSGNITAVDAASTAPASLIAGQSLVTGTPTANSSVSATLSGTSSYSVQLSGTWVGTVQFEKSVDGGTTWVSLGMTGIGTTTAATSVTGTGANSNAILHGNSANITNVRVRCTAYTSGTCAVKIQPSYGVFTVLAAQSGAPWSQNITQLGGTTIDTNSGNKGAGTERVVLATDQPQLTNALKVDGSAVTQPVSGTFWQATQPVSGTFWQATQPVSIADGANTTFGAKADAKSTATDTTAVSAMAVLKEISAMAQSPAALPNNQSVNVSQINGVTPLMGAGNTGTGSARVTIASDQAEVASKVAAGSNVTEGNTTDTAAADANGTINAHAREVAKDTASIVANGVKVTNGTQAADTVAGDSGQNSLVTNGARKEVTFTTTTAQAVASTDVSNYRWASVHLINQGTNATVTFQSSNDNSNWVSTALQRIDNPASGGTLLTTSTTGGSNQIWAGWAPARYFRLNVTGITAGTTSGTVEFFANGSTMPSRVTVDAGSGNFATNAAQIAGSTISTSATGVQKVGVVGNAGATVDGVIGAATAPTDMFAVGGVYNSTEVAPTTGQSTALQIDSKGRLKDTIRDAAGNDRGVNVNASNQLSTSLDNVAYNTGTRSATTQRVTVATDDIVPASQSGTWTMQPGNTANTTPWLMQAATGTANGWSVNSQTALTNTKVAVKASAGNFGGYMVYNPNSSVEYVQVWDVASGSVTVGTTAPTYVIPIPATSGANLELSLGITHATAITLAATTTPTGSTAPGSNLVGFFLFK